MKTKIRKSITAVVALAAVLGWSAIAASAAEVSVQVQPKTFSADRGGQLSITVSGGNFDGSVNPPTPDGIGLRPYGKSQNIQIINGRMSRTISQNFMITADEPGDYTIPSFELVVDGETIKTDPVKFTVVAGSAPPSLSSPSQGTPGQSGVGAADAATTESFLKLDFPPRQREHLYVGEMAPVRITAYFPARSQVSLRSSPRPEGEGFTLHNLSEEPEQDFAVVDGKEYRTVSWFAGVSTVKAGEYPIRIALDATVMVPDRSQSRSRPRSMFGSSLFNDPFFDDFFDNAFTRMVPREMSLTSDGDPLDIRSLPTEGKPENFSGAVGEFSLGSYKLPADAKTGEPRQIRVTVEGTGNFDRASAPSLLPADVWKTYSPKTDFTPGDSTSFSGKKTFEFSAVPQKGGNHEARLSFSYFDPAKESYETVTSPAISLAISGEDVSQQRTSVASNAAASTDNMEDSENTGERKASSDLAPARVVGSAGSPVVIALFYEMLFWILIASAGALIIFGLAARVIRKRLSDPVRVANRETVRAENDALAAARDAAQDKNARAFFTAARTGLQTRLAAAWDRPAGSITLSEVRSHFTPDSPTLKVFTTADAIAYAPANAQHDFNPEQWMSTLRAAMEEVATSARRETVAA